MLRVVVGVGVIASLGACWFVFEKQREWNLLRDAYFDAQWACDTHYHSMIHQKQEAGWCTPIASLPGVCRYALSAEEQLNLASRPECYTATSLKAKLPFFVLPD